MEEGESEREAGWRGGDFAKTSPTNFAADFCLGPSSHTTSCLPAEAAPASLLTQHRTLFLLHFFPPPPASVSQVGWSDAVAAANRLLTEMSSSVSATSTIMRPTHAFDRKVDDMKPSKSDINWVIMDYLVSEGYPGAAEKFAQETNIANPVDIEDIRERVRIRNAIHAGKIKEAVEMINDMDMQILDTNPQLHFSLLQLQFIEIVRVTILNVPGGKPVGDDFRPAIEFATDQMAPRAPTDPRYQKALEHSMALLVYEWDKMPQDFKDLLDLKLREKVATSVNTAILESRGERSEAKIRQLVRARAWAEAQAREARIDVPADVSIGLDPPAPSRQNNGDAILTDAMVN